MVGTIGISRLFVCESGASVYENTWVVWKSRIIGRREAKEVFGEGQCRNSLLGKTVLIFFLSNVFRAFIF